MRPTETEVRWVAAAHFEQAGDGARGMPRLGARPVDLRTTSARPLGRQGLGTGAVHRLFYHVIVCDTPAVPALSLSFRANSAVPRLAAFRPADDAVEKINKPSSQ